MSHLIVSFMSHLGSSQSLLLSMLFSMSSVNHKRFIRDVSIYLIKMFLSEMLCRTLNSFSDFQLNDISINKLDQSVAEF
jgi:hypothetical protein